MKALLLCAGLGTRLRPHTEWIAKPVLPVLNISMLSYPLYFLEQAGLQNLLVNTHHRPESVKQAVRTAVGGRYPFELLHESPKILGSGGAIWNARTKLQPNENFLVANGDSVMILQNEKSFADTLTLHQSKKALATLMVVPHEQAGQSISAVWVELDSNGDFGAIRGFGLKAPDGAPNALPFHFVGLAAYSSRVFSILPEGESNILYEILLPALNRGETVLAHVVRESLWFETGNERDFLSANGALLTELTRSSQRGEVLRRILNRFSPGWNALNPKPGVFLHQHSQIERGTFPEYALIGANCQLHPDAQFSKAGFVVMGESSDVQEPCLLENVVLLPGAITQARGHLAHTIVSQSQDRSKLM